MTKWVYYQDTPLVSTFSIVALDPETEELGIAVQSLEYMRKTRN